MTTPSTPSRHPPEDLAYPESPTRIVAWGLFMFAILATVGLFQLISGNGLLPYSLCTASGGAVLPGCDENIRFGVAAFAGAVGASIYAIERFIQHAIKDKDFGQSYTSWYVLRPLQGSLLALMFYLLLRGGLLALGAGTGENAGTLDLYGLASICAMVGLFSKDAMERLRQTFQTLFATKEPSSQAQSAGSEVEEEKPGSQLSTVPGPLNVQAEASSQPRPEAPAPQTSPSTRNPDPQAAAGVPAAKLEEGRPDPQAAP
jgi:hypothetical protein